MTFGIITISGLADTSTYGYGQAAEVGNGLPDLVGLFFPVNVYNSRDA